MPQRIDLDQQLAHARAPIDAGWSKRKKTVVAAASVCVAALALGYGVWMTIAQRPPRLPTSAEEALKVMDSAKYDRLGEERKRQYASETRRLLQGLTAEERRALLQGEDNEDLRSTLRDQFVDDLARRVARGDEPEIPGFGADARKRQRARWDALSDEEKEQRQREMKDRARERIADAIESGNAQSTGLRTELFKKMGGRRRGR